MKKVRNLTFINERERQFIVLRLLVSVRLANNRSVSGTFQ